MTRNNLTERRSASLRKKGGEKMFEAEIVARNMLAKRNTKGWSQTEAAEKPVICQNTLTEK